MKYFISIISLHKDKIASIGVVSENNRKYYAISKELLSELDNIRKNDWWLNQYFIPCIFKDLNQSNSIFGLTEDRYWEKLKEGLQTNGKTEEEIVMGLLEFIQSPSEFWSLYYSKEVWNSFFSLFGGGVEKLPESWPKECHDLEWHLKNKGWDSDQFQKLRPSDHVNGSAIKDAKWGMAVVKALT